MTKTHLVKFLTRQMWVELRIEVEFLAPHKIKRRIKDFYRQLEPLKVARCSACGDGILGIDAEWSAGVLQQRLSECSMIFIFYIIRPMVDTQVPAGRDQSRDLFGAYIYYNKNYTGSYLPLLLEVLCITDFYGVNAYSTYINDRIIELITDVPICLMIATEARKHGTLAKNIYSRCLEFLSEALNTWTAVCYDVNSGDSKAWCCHAHSTKCKRHTDPKDSSSYTVSGQLI
ncbi:unnamed protein product [Mortierella alpina]